MEIIGTIILMTCVIILGCMAESYKAEAAKQEAYNAIYVQRQMIAERIAMECYCRLYKQDAFIRRDEMLINIFDLLNVYGISSQVDAQNKRVVNTSPHPEAEEQCMACDATTCSACSPLNRTDEIIP